MMGAHSEIEAEVKRRMKAVSEDPSALEEQTAIMIAKLRAHEVRLMKEVLVEIKAALAEDSQARLLAPARPRRRKHTRRIGALG